MIDTLEDCRESGRECDAACPVCARRAALIKEITDALYELGCGCGFDWYADVVLSALKKCGYRLEKGETITAA